MRNASSAPWIVRQFSGAALGGVLLSAGASGQVTTRASVDTAGGDSNHHSGSPSISADGNYVAFWSFASDLVAGDKNGAHDIFVRDLVNGVTERVSVDSGGTEANSSSWYPAISADGLVAVFESDAKNLVAGDTNGFRDIFLHDRGTGATERVSVDSAGVESNWTSSWAAVSADGMVVAYESIATNLVAGDTNGLADVFVYDRATGITERVSVDSYGAEANGDSHRPQLSDDGQFVVFSSFATNLVPGDTNFRSDIFVHDRATGVTERVSVSSSGAEADLNSGDASISGDGQRVVFASNSILLVPGLTSAATDVFLRDRASGLTTLVSHDPAGGEGDKSSVWPKISRNGRSVTYYSYATDLVAGDGNARADVFVTDLDTDHVDRMSVDTAGGDSDGDSTNTSISGDGRIVAFASAAKDLVAGDGNGASDVFARDRCITDASWTNYGNGLAGTLGVPSFTARGDPVLGTTITLDLGNSAGVTTTGLLFIGTARAQVPWKGGDLLVQIFQTVPLSVPAAGLTLDFDLPQDWSWGGIVADVQAAEFDPGAPRKWSLTPGLELVMGR